MALIAVMTASTLLLALGLSLALTTTVETGIAANHRDGLQSLHAADAALERAVAELAATPDWDAVLAGAVTATFNDGRGAGIVGLPDGSALDLAGETNRLRCGTRAACGDADMDVVAAARPWGRNNPRWQIYACGPLAQLLPDAAIASRAYVIVWVADDPSENDADPRRDGQPPAVVDPRNPGNPGRGALWLHARAYGVGSRRTIDAIVERDARSPASRLRIRVWRETT